MTEETWPWRELRDLADDLYGEIRKRVTAVMNGAGEDPDDRDLYEEHVLQVAFSLKARAEQESNPVLRFPGFPPVRGASPAITAVEEGK